VEVEECLEEVEEECLEEPEELLEIYSVPLLEMKRMTGKLKQPKKKLPK